MNYEQKHPILLKLKEYFNNTPKEQIKKDWYNILKDTDNEAYYEKKYKEASKWVDSIFDELTHEQQMQAEAFFPELKESKDERIRKTIYGWIHTQPSEFFDDGFSKEEMLAWVEKQGEQKQTWSPSAAQLIVIKDMIEDKNTSKVNKVILRGMLKEIEDVCPHEIEKQGEPIIEIPFGASDSELQEVSYDIPEGFHAEIKDDGVVIKKVEPKFKVGDWVISNNKKSTYQVIEVKRGIYVIRDNVDNHEYHIGIEECEKSGRLWTINDAKDGDVIYVSTETMGIQAIFHKFENGIIYFHCNLCSDFMEGGYEPSGDVKFVHPLLKTQYQKFFQKMKQSGYEWRQEEKKLIKINESKFKVGDWVILNGTVAQILDKQKYGFVGLDIDGKDFFCNYGHTDSMRLWTIADAKDGDVLVGKDGRPFIFTGEFDVQDDNPIAYCGINSNDKFITGCGSHWTFKDGVKPATKEKRDLLFEKMRNVGYMWDLEKKELKKIEVASKDNKNERIKREIIAYINELADSKNEKIPTEWLEWLEKQSKMLDTNKVIEWLNGQACLGWIEDVEVDKFIEKFKKDFGL